MNTKTSRNIATGAAASLAAIVVLMMVPTADTAPQGPAFYGMAEVVQMGPDGEIKSSQQVHNRIIDEGEEFMLDALFNTSVPLQASFNVICVSGFYLNATLDNEAFITSSNPGFEPGLDGDTLADSRSPCKTVELVERPGDGTATIYATFVGGTSFGDDLEPAGIFSSIGICVADAASPGDWCNVANDDLGTNAIGEGVFAVAGITPVTVVDEESYRVSYKLDLSSDSS